MAKKIRHPLTYGQLPQTAGDLHVACLSPGCDRFGETFSATRGDYWMMAPDDVVLCDCGEPMHLGRQVTRIVPVTTV